MNSQFAVPNPTRMKAWLIAICLVVAGMSLSASILVLNPKVFLAISDSLNWRLGTPSVLQARLESTLQTFHLRSDPLIGEQSILLLGDSHLHSFPTLFLQGPVVNYSIGGETAESLAKRVVHYKSLSRAKQVILLTGLNDLMQGRSPKGIAISIAQVLDHIPATTSVALVGIPPLRRADNMDRSILETNHLLANLCSGRTHCMFINTQSLADASGSLRSNFATADGIHLSSAGYAQLAILLNSALRQPIPLQHP